MLIWCFEGFWKATVDLPDIGAVEIPAVTFSMADGRMYGQLFGDTSTAVYEGAAAADSVR